MEFSYDSVKNTYSITISIEIPIQYIYSSVRGASKIMKIDNSLYTNWLDEQDIRYTIESTFESYNGYRKTTIISGLTEEEILLFKLRFEN